MTAQLFINGRFLSQDVTGVQRYARETIGALDALLCDGLAAPHEVRVSILAPHDAADLPRLQRITLRRVGRLRGHAWEQLELPLHARNGLLLNLCNTAPLARTRQIATLHDAAVHAVPHAYRFAFRAWYALLFGVAGRLSRRVVTVSEFSRDELARHVGLDRRDIAVVTEGKEHILAVPSDRGVIERHGLARRPFVLAVSSMSPHKNFAAVVRAVELLGDASFDVVVAGGAHPRIFAGAALPANVKHVGYVSDGELRALYEQAACFVYPSIYEGFGLPPLEAMACGCPVIVAQAASLPEVCGNAALYCDPHAATDIAAQIRRLVDDVALRDSLRRRGHLRAAQFTWRRCALQNWAVIAATLDLPRTAAHMEKFHA